MPEAWWRMFARGSSKLIQRLMNIDDIQHVCSQLLQNYSNSIERKAQEVARKVSTAYQHVGLLAVELFLTKEGEIWVNEVAPRPDENTGA